jgi:hypothetical protein
MMCVRSKIKKIEKAVFNTLQLAIRKYLLQMSLQWSLSLLTIVTTGPLERSNCRVHLRGRCRDLLTDAVLTLE